MPNHFSFWAQALDNTSPDHFYHEGIELPADEKAKRREVVVLVSNVIKQGHKKYDDGGVLLTSDHRAFVLEVPVLEQDVLGRGGAITAYGPISSNEMEVSFLRELNAFATDVGRSFLPDTLERVHGALIFLGKNNRAEFKQKNSGCLMLLATISIIFITGIIWTQAQ